MITEYHSLTNKVIHDHYPFIIIHYRPSRTTKSEITINNNIENKNFCWSLLVNSSIVQRSGYFHRSPCTIRIWFVGDEIWFLFGDWLGSYLWVLSGENKSWNNFHCTVRISPSYYNNMAQIEIFVLHPGLSLGHILCRERVH